MVLLSGRTAARCTVALLSLEPAAGGIAAGAFFALTAMAVRGAILGLPEGTS